MNAFKPFANAFIVFVNVFKPFANASKVFVNAFKPFANAFKVFVSPSKPFANASKGFVKASQLWVIAYHPSGDVYQALAPRAALKKAQHGADINVAK